MLRLWLQAAALLWLSGRGAGGPGRLYSDQDPLLLLGGRSLKPTVTNSSSAWLVQFYSSWCGHCIQYSSTWKALAQDVADWREAIAVAVLDCAQEENFEVCKEFGIKFFPTFKYFAAHSSAEDKGTLYRGADREVRSVRQLMVNILQNHSRTDRPRRCPPLEPYSAAELLPLLGQRSDGYTAIVLEEAESFVGREVILDLLPFSGVEVRRALTSDLPLLHVLNMAAFPSVYLLHPNGSHGPLHSEKPLRFFFSSLLRSLPGVQRRRRSEAAPIGTPQDGAPAEPRRDFDRSQVYLADLEAALRYLLRVELAAHGALEGAELQVFKDFVTLVAKLYPAGGSVATLMETLSDWLLRLPLQQIPYQAVLDLVDDKMKMSGVSLGTELRWVGCQGSSLRRYPCSLWTLFHVLTVRHDAAPDALRGSGLEGQAAPVLQVMRRYVRTFFGCQECGRHFETAAAASMERVAGPEEQVLWLWEQHNRVNARLAGSLSDDPASPKAPWPSPALCPACHEESGGVHVWSRLHVLAFLRRHYGAANLNPSYSLAAGAGPREARPELPPGPRQAERAVLIRGEGGFWILGLGFTSVDMSLCVVLYGSSCLFLMLLFFFFKVRSSRWKLRHARLHV